MHHQTATPDLSSGVKGKMGGLKSELVDELSRRFGLRQTGREKASYSDKLRASMASSRKIAVAFGGQRAPGGRNKTTAWGNGSSSSGSAQNATPGPTDPIFVYTSYS